MRKLWLAVGVALLVALTWVAATAPQGSGSAWDDGGDDGHSLVLDSLAQRNEVRVIKSSLALLPQEAGDDDILFLFPTHRPAADSEVTRVHRFVVEGGVLVMAADGQNAAPWARMLGIKYQGLPAWLTPDAKAGCVPARVPVGASEHAVCLPSPTTFPDLAKVAGDISFTHVAYSEIPVFLDTDLDGNLSIGDQGPVEAPMMLQWDLGRGHVFALADGDAWRNRVVQDNNGSSNLLLAQALAGQVPGTVYFDSSGRQDSILDRSANLGYRTLSSHGPSSITALAALLAVMAIAVATAPRATPVRPHDPPVDMGDPEVEQAAEEVLRAHLEPQRPDRPPRPRPNNT